MTSWFKTEAIDNHTFALCEPHHWERANSYLLLGQNAALLIDTGLGIGDIHQLVGQLTNLPIIVATTHVHWDHIGGHHSFKDIGVHPAEAEWMQNGIPIPLPAVRQMVVRDVAPDLLPEGFDIDSYIPYQGVPSRLLNDGDVLDLGGRQVQVLHTPGHSPGHICLWEPDRGYLYTGDLLYAATLFAHYPSTDPVAFAASITRIAGLKGVKKLLPGHHHIDLPLDMPLRAKQAFDDIQSQGLLHHGGGLFDHGDFAIQI